MKSALVELGRWDSTLVMTYAEFGRRARENDSKGTDHGTVAPHFAMGGRVRGGLYGTPPTLARLDGHGNLPLGVDFRQLVLIRMSIPSFVDGRGKQSLTRYFGSQADHADQRDLSRRQSDPECVRAQWSSMPSRTAGPEEIYGGEALQSHLSCDHIFGSGYTITPFLRLSRVHAACVATTYEIRRSSLNRFFNEEGLRLIQIPKTSLTGHQSLVFRFE